MPARDASPFAGDLDLITRAAEEAGRTALGYFRNAPEVTWKNGGNSPVSAADFAANDVLKEMLLPARPNYGWLSEETDDDPARLACETLFVVDPIDGTRAFIAGKDLWCVSVAVVHAGRPVAGVLYAPALGEIFQATLDGPALKNGAAISVAREGDAALKVASAEDMIARLEPGFRTGVSRVQHVPSLAYRLAMVADGRIDATIVKTGSHDWDLAAADLILERAGGTLQMLDASPLTYNRASVKHPVLCAAANDRLAGLIAAGQAMEGH